MKGNGLPIKVGTAGLRQAGWLAFAWQLLLPAA